MYPHIFGIEILDSYIVFVCLGVIAALFIFRYFSSAFKLSDKAFKMYGILLATSIAAGFFFAFLFQSVYTFIDKGVFKLGGVTFMGGLVGGVGTFIVLSLIFAKGGVKNEMWNVISLAPIGIAAAHCLGRVGCFLAGCCYGVETKHGLDFHVHTDPLGTLRLPTQLIEVIFLALLCGALILLVLKFKRFSLTAIVYLFAYSIFRFILEFWRDDYRGGTGFFSPSQWQSVFMFTLAAFLTVYIFVLKRIPFNGKQEGNLSGFLFENQPNNNQPNDNQPNDNQPNDNKVK